MAKVKVVTQFRDKFNASHWFNPSEVVEFDEERANDVISRGLCVAVEEPTPAVDETNGKKGKRTKTTKQGE